MDQIISKGMGKVKAVKARIGGLVGIFRTLAEQHGQVSAMLHRINADKSKRADLWPLVRTELLSHEEGEVRELYPLLRAHPETQEIADHHDQEAGEMKRMIEELDMLPLESEAWGTKFEQLVKTVLHHASEEENEFFPKAQKAIGETMARTLDEAFLRAKQQAQS